MVEFFGGGGRIEVVICDWVGELDRNSRSLMLNLSTIFVVDVKVVLYL